ANSDYPSQCPDSLDVQFTDTSTGYPRLWSWSFGDDQTSSLQNTSHTCSSIRDYTVTLTATNSAGSNMVTKTVHVPDCPGPGNPPDRKSAEHGKGADSREAQFTDTSTGYPTSWSANSAQGAARTPQYPTHTWTQ